MPASIARRRRVGRRARYAYGRSLAAERAGRLARKPAATPAPPDPPAPGTPGGLPDDRTPISETPFTPDSAQGAGNVVQTCYALLGMRKYADARALRTPGADGAGASATAFAAAYERYDEYRGLVGSPGKSRPGRGSVTSPCPFRSPRG